MFEKLQNIFKVPVLKRKVLFTLGLFASTGSAGTSPRPA